jgi:iron complex outermembrane receptor protein
MRSARRTACLFLAPLALASVADAATLDSGETVVVTAQRRPELARDVPAPVTAFGAEDLVRTGATTIADLAGFVPGMTFLSETPGSNLLVLRGVATGTTQLNSAVAMYVDDVPIGISTPFGLGASAHSVNTFDLNRVEILSGPQGTLYGANALGGAVKYVTMAPRLGDLSFTGKSSVSGTNHGGSNTGLYGAVNAPLGQSVAIRITGIDQSDPGYVNDPDHGRDGLGGTRTLGARVSVLAQLTPEMDLRLSALTQGIAANGFAYAFRDPVTHRPTQGPFDQSFALAQPSYDSLTLYSAALNWKLPWASLAAITGYQYDHGRKLLDESTAYDAILSAGYGPAVANLPFGVKVNVGTRKFTQELRLASPDGAAVTWLVGGFYSDERTGETIDFVNGADPGGLLFGSVALHSVIPSSYREGAIFADGTLHVADGLDVTLGIRYSENRQDYQQISFGLLSNPAAPARVLHLEARSQGDVATFLINPRYRISENVMTYIRVANGYRPGGPNFSIPTYAGIPQFQPDTLWNYEAGVKSSWLDGRASIEAAVYDIEWTSIQLNVNHDGFNQLENAGDARVRGVEGSAQFHVTEGLTVRGMAAFTDARLTTPVPGLGLAQAGTRLPLSPRIQFALAVSQKFQLGATVLEARIADRYTGDRTNGYAGSTINPLYDLAAYNMVDGGFSASLPGGFTLDIFARNLLDTRGEISATTFTNHYVPGAPVPVTLTLPRTIGLALRADING